MKKLSIICCISMIVGLFGAGSVFAISIDFNPVSGSVILGENFSVDVVISGLGDRSAPSLGTYDIDIHYNPLVLGLDGSDPNTVVFGDQLYLGVFPPIQGTDFSTPGVLSIAETSLDKTDSMDSMQLGSFILATVTFDAIGPGTSDLYFDIIELGNASATEIAEISKGNASVTVNPVNPVPEPATLMLFGIGLAGLAGFGRRKIKSS